MTGIRIPNPPNSMAAQSKMDLKERPLRKQMEYTAEINARLVMIVDQEKSKKTRSDSSMKTGEETDMTECRDWEGSTREIVLASYH
jgi:hypothetical protein